MRVSELKKLGSVPEKSKDQVTFFIDLESKIQDILNLGAKGDHLGRLAYGQEVFNAIFNRLTVTQHLKLLAVPGDMCSREKLIKSRVMCGERCRSSLMPHGGKLGNSDPEVGKKQRPMANVLRKPVPQLNHGVTLC